MWYKSIFNIDLYHSWIQSISGGWGPREYFVFLISRDFSRERGQLPNSLDTVLMHIICIIVLLEQVLTILCRSYKIKSLKSIQ